jgi:hypothetical protein
MPLKGLFDGPIFGREQGTLTALQNMEIKASGYAEARGGMEELKPNGGTAADAASAGAYSCVHQVNTSYGWIRTYDSAAAAGSRFSKNLQLDPGGWPPFPTNVVNDAVYCGSDLPFSRITTNLMSSGGAALVGATFAYEYWNGSTWAALTTAETITWSNINATQYASWTLPTNWVASAEGDTDNGTVLKYWMRVRLSAISSGATGFCHWIFGTWVGMRELYEINQNPRGGASTASLKRLGQTGTTTQWYEVLGSMFSGASQPARAASYRGRLYFTTGREQDRWDGANINSIGLQKFAATATLSGPGAFTGIGAGIWRYYVAWGYGQNNFDPTSGSTQRDLGSLYGVGEALATVGGATYANEITTTLGNEEVYITITGTMPTDAGGIYVYRTQDLTGVPVSDRDTFPAFLITSRYRITTGTNPATAIQGGGIIVDNFPAPVFPPVEAVLYDNKPPERCKYVAVYQNRLLLGDDLAWYWSDPFKPDIFQRATNFISLARAQGGRHMGGVEFADQVVLFTEDQTWGLTNIDMDVPHLYPIHPAVGCVAPESIAVGDGVLVWAAKDGFYAWDGTGLPKRISDSMDQTFGSMSYETHGGSRATIHNGRYDIRIASADMGTIGLAYRFSLEAFLAKKHPWSTILLAGFASTLAPLATIHAPLGNNDAGMVHSIWGKVDYTTAAGEYGLFLGELTTQDAGSNYSCAATMHFPLPPNRLLSTARLLAYYQATNGWGTPALAFTPTTFIGSSPGTLNTGTPDTGDDYSLIGGTFSAVPRGLSDIQISFTVASSASGTVNRQRFFGAVLEGNPAGIRRGQV